MGFGKKSGREIIITFGMALCIYTITSLFHPFSALMITLYRAREQDGSRGKEDEDEDDSSPTECIQDQEEETLLATDQNQAPPANRILQHHHPRKYMFTHNLLQLR